MGIEAYISNLSMEMAHANAVTQSSVKMMKNVMDSTEENAAQMIQQMENLPPPAPAGSLGGLLDTSG